MWFVFFLACWCVCVASGSPTPPYTHLAQPDHSGDTVNKLKGLCNDIGGIPTDDDQKKLIDFLQFLVKGQNEAIDNLASEVDRLAALLSQAEAEKKQEEDKRLKLEDDVKDLTERLQQEQDKLTQITGAQNTQASDIARLQQELLDERAKVVQLLQDNGEINSAVSRLEQEKQEEAAKALLLEEKVKAVQLEEQAKVRLAEAEKQQEEDKRLKLEEDVKDLTERLQQEQDKLTQITGSGNTQASDIVRLQQELLDSQARVAQLLQDNSAVSRLEQELLQERAKVAQLESDLAALRDAFRNGVKPRDCKAWQRLGYTQSGVYRIYPLDDSCEGVQAWCDMDTDGGGWTVFLSRQYQVPPLDFSQTWQSYEDGFGSAAGEYWLGNLYLYALTKGEQQVLRLDVSDTNGDVRFAEWGEFSVGGKASKFQMAIDNFSPASTMGNVFPYTTPTKFSTVDQDNDHAGQSCTSYYGRGGWWYRKCFNILPTARLHVGTGAGDPAIDEVKTAFWNPGDSTNVALSEVHFKIRPLA